MRQVSDRSDEDAVYNRVQPPLLPSIGEMDPTVIMALFLCVESEIRIETNYSTVTASPNIVSNVTR